MDAFVQPGHEVINRDPFPVSTVEHLVLQPSEEPFAGRVVGRASLLGHRPCQVVPLHQLYPSGPPVMAAPVGVDYRIALVSQMCYAICQHRVCKPFIPHDAPHNLLGDGPFQEDVGCAYIRTGRRSP